MVLRHADLRSCSSRDTSSLPHPALPRHFGRQSYAEFVFYLHAPGTRQSFPVGKDVPITAFRRGNVHSGPLQFKPHRLPNSRSVIPMVQPHSSMPARVLSHVPQGSGPPHLFHLRSRQARQSQDTEREALYLPCATGPVSLALVRPLVAPSFHLPRRMHPPTKSTYKLLLSCQAIPPANNLNSSSRRPPFLAVDIWASVHTRHSLQQGPSDSGCRGCRVGRLRLTCSRRRATWPKVRWKVLRASSSGATCCSQGS